MCYTAMCHTKITQETFPHRFSPTKLPRRGIQAAAAAVTLLFLQLKLGHEVSGDSPPAAPLAKVVEICYNRIRSDSVNGFQKKEVQKDA